MEVGEKKFTQTSGTVLSVFTTELAPLYQSLTRVLSPWLPPHSPGDNEEGGVGQTQKGAPKARWDSCTHLSLLHADFAQPHRMRAVIGGLYPALGADILGTKYRPGHTQLCRALSCQLSG